jgi:hypothetical protein
MKAWSNVLEEGRIAIRCCLVISLALTLLLLLSVGGQTQRQFKGSATRPTILSLKIKAITLQRADMDEALTVLRQQNISEIMIGFEEVQRVRGPQRKPISLETTETTVGNLLDRFVAADPRYTYEVTKDSIINVYPRGAKEDPNDLLNTKVSKFVIHGKYYLPSVIRRIDRWVPELKNRMEKAQEEYQRKLSLGPYGSATAGTPWNTTVSTVPELNLEAQNVSVRELLNSFILHSANIYQGQPNGFPVSWKYEFIIDPDAPTGLGGYPGWGQLGEEIPQEISW